MIVFEPSPPLNLKNMEKMTDGKIIGLTWDRPLRANGADDLTYTVYWRT